MGDTEQIIENKKFEETYVLNGSVIGPMSPDIVVRQFPLVHGDYQKLISVDHYDRWQSNFLAAFVTAALNFISKLTVFHYVQSYSATKPEIWELVLIVLTGLGLLVSSILRKYCPSSKKKLKKKIEDRIGRY